jgi:hypothetical protein
MAAKTAARTSQLQTLAQDDLRACRPALAPPLLSSESGHISAEPTR